MQISQRKNIFPAAKLSNSREGAGSLLVGQLGLFLFPILARIRLRSRGRGGLRLFLILGPAGLSCATGGLLDVGLFQKDRLNLIGNVSSR
jgi:hypothetical protein